MSQLLKPSILIGLGVAEYEHCTSGGCIASLVIITISLLPVLLHSHLIFQSDMLPIGDTISGEVGHEKAMVLTSTIHDSLEHISIDLPVAVVEMAFGMTYFRVADG